MKTPLTHEELSFALLENSPAAPATEPRLHAVLTQAASNPGKLTRARLVLAGALAQGLDDDGAVQLACGVEYYHLASLLLDDLPCMDNADTRRGLPCAHRVHGEAATILGALALINRAYALIGFALAAQPTGVRLQAMACLDACLGTAGLTGGQAHDLAFARSDRTARTIGRIALAKTGALFMLAVYLPALTGGLNPEERRRLKALCVYWGLAIQVRDDLVDVLSSSFGAGKTTGRDEALVRPNLALVLGEDAARRRIWRLLTLSGRTCRALESGGDRWSYLRTFQETMTERASEPSARRESAA